MYPIISLHNIVVEWFTDLIYLFRATCPMTFFFAKVVYLGEIKKMTSRWNTALAILEVHSHTL